MDNDRFILYHGSPRPLEKAIFGFGSIHNDYGRGFYCTRNEELAKEWACPGGDDGFANQYSLPVSGLSVLDLSSAEMNVMNWLAVLLENRDFPVLPGLPARARTYILDSFLPDYKSFDVIRGYRADDSYFAFAKAFLNGTLSLEQLAWAMHLGNLGEQIVLKSKRAFDTVEFERATPCSAIVWNTRRKRRDEQARESYRRMVAEAPPEGAVYIIDIIREKWSNDDARLR